MSSLHLEGVGKAVKSLVYCPRCATENELEQGFCRHCGQSLADLQLALEGRATEALDRLKAGAKWMNGGIATLISFTFIAILIAIAGVAVGNPSLSSIAMINVLLGALIGLPLVFIGKARVKRATRLLSGTQPQIGHGGSNALRRPSELLTTGLDKSAQSVRAPGSVTEHTTFDLQERGRIDGH